MRYVAFVLDDLSRKVLLSKFPPAFDKVIAHHVTLSSHGRHTPEAGEDQMVDQVYQDYLFRGAYVRVHDYVRGETIEAVGVTVNRQVKKANGQHYHITLSLSALARPVESNDLFPSVTSVESFVLTGTVQILGV